MSRDKVSEWSSTAANNTDIAGINIAEGCAPSGINNAIRELMAQVKDMQTGADNDGLVVGGTFTSSGGAVFSSTITANGSVGSSGQVLASRGAGLSPQWSSVGFVAGMIVMWSGTVATIPSGWVLCDGTNSTPDLRDKFVIGARQDDSGVAKTNVTGSLTQTGGSKDAIVVSHTHSVTDPGHNHTINTDVGSAAAAGVTTTYALRQKSTTGGTTGSSSTGITIDSTGSSGTNANLVPYYALAFIQKT